MLFRTGLSKNSRPINTFDADVQFDLGSECEGYGILNGFNQGMSITVPYSWAFSNFLSFSSSGKEWEGRLPLVARISASGIFGKKYLGDLEQLFIVGSNTIGEIFYQNDTKWKDSVYDHINSTIGNVGCALTSMAMVLSAYGVDVDPGKLNAWMKENGGYDDNGGVKWKTLTEYPNSPITLDKYVLTNNSQNLDNCLSRGDLAIAKVINVSTGNQHWIVITDKTDGGDYTIVDPNGRNYQERTLLQNSYGNYLRYVTVKSKQP